MLSAHQSIYDLPNGNGPPYPLRPDSPYPHPHLFDPEPVSSPGPLTESRTLQWAHYPLDDPESTTMPPDYLFPQGIPDSELRGSTSVFNSCLTPPTPETSSASTRFDDEGNIALRPLRGFQVGNGDLETVSEDDDTTDDDMPALESAETSDTDSDTSSETDSDSGSDQSTMDIRATSIDGGSDDEDNDEDDDDDGANPEEFLMHFSQAGVTPPPTDEGDMIPTTAYEILSRRSGSYALREARKRAQERRLAELRLQQSLAGPASTADKFVDAVTPRRYDRLLSTHHILDPGTPAYVHRDRYRSILLKLNRGPSRHGV